MSHSSVGNENVEFEEQRNRRTSGTEYFAGDWNTLKLYEKELELELYEKSANDGFTVSQKQSQLNSSFEDERAPI